MTSRHLPANEQISMGSGSQGFTLIEIMVVVLIIAIMIGAAVLSVGSLGSDRDLQREARRLKALMELVQEEALMQGRDYGIKITADAYDFLVFDHDQFAWGYPVDEDLFRAHQLPEEIAMELFLDGREIVLEEEPEPEEAETPEPHIMILASGEMTPFELGFYRELLGGRFIITGELNGALELDQDGFDQP